MVCVQSLESTFTDLRATVTEKSSGTINTYFHQFQRYDLMSLYFKTKYVRQIRIHHIFIIFLSFRSLYSCSFGSKFCCYLKAMNSHVISEKSYLSSNTSNNLISS
jgi:hypothetical protein